MYYWVVGVLVLDRITKLLVEWRMEPGQSRQLLGSWVQLTHIRNTGAAFGMLAGQRYLFLVLTILLLAALLAWYLRAGHRHVSAPAMGLVLGGALGNLVDRAARGHVVDFIDLRVWPVFNVADVTIVAGCVLLGIQIYRLGSRQEEGESRG